MTLDYGNTRIGEREYILPAHFELLQESSGRVKRSANYGSYRKFETEATFMPLADEEPSALRAAAVTTEAKHGHLRLLLPHSYSPFRSGPLPSRVSKTTLRTPVLTNLHGQSWSHSPKFLLNRDHGRRSISVIIHRRVAVFHQL